MTAREKREGTRYKKREKTAPRSVRGLTPLVTGVDVEDGGLDFDTEYVSVRRTFRRLREMAGVKGSAPIHSVNTTVKLLRELGPDGSLGQFVARVYQREEVLPGLYSEVGRWFVEALGREGAEELTPEQVEQWFEGWKDALAERLAEAIYLRIRENIDLIMGSGEGGEELRRAVWGGILPKKKGRRKRGDKEGGTKGR